MLKQNVGSYEVYELCAFWFVQIDKIGGKAEGEGREKTIGSGGVPRVDGRASEFSGRDQPYRAPMSFSALAYVLFAREWVGGGKKKHFLLSLGGEKVTWREEERSTLPKGDHCPKIVKPN